MISTCRQKIDVCLFSMGLAMFAVVETASAHGVLHLTHGRWFDGSSFVARDFYSVDGVLRDSYDGQATEVDLGDGFVLPGYGDAHTHGIGGSDPEAESQRYLAAGIYYAANPNSSSARLRASREQLASPETIDARLAGGGITSSGGHPIQIFEGAAQNRRHEGDAYFVVNDVADLESTWESIVANEPDFLKVYLENSEFHAERKGDPDYFGKRGLDPSLIAPIVERAHTAGLRVAAHVTSRADFNVAVRAGVDEIAHLPLAPLEREDAKAAAARGITVVTTVLSHRPADHVEDLTGLHRANLQLLKDAGVHLVLGTDSQATVVDELIAIDAMGIFERDELLRLLVVDTPRWIFPNRNVGEFEVGAEASFVLLESNPLEDPTALKMISARVKSGHPIEIDTGAQRRGVGQYLAHHLMANGVESAVEEYHRLREEEADDWDFSEGQLNALGYAMLQHGKLAEATAMFQLNCDQYPESANAWDSLAESYMERGEIDAAIDNYERSLELDPNNLNAKERLAELRAM